MKGVEGGGGRLDETVSIARLTLALHTHAKREGKREEEKLQVSIYELEPSKVSISS